MIVPRIARKWRSWRWAGPRADSYRRWPSQVTSTQRETGEPQRKRKRDRDRQRECVVTLVPRIARKWRSWRWGGPRAGWCRRWPSPDPSARSGSGARGAKSGTGGGTSRTATAAKNDRHHRRHNIHRYHHHHHQQQQQQQHHHHHHHHHPPPPPPPHLKSDERDDVRLGNQHMNGRQHHVMLKPAQPPPP
jgi:hypothetical protein